MEVEREEKGREKDSAQEGREGERERGRRGRVSFF